MLASECGFTGNRSPLTVIAEGVVWPSMASGRGVQAHGKGEDSTTDGI